MTATNKILRAKKHFVELNEDIQKYWHSNPYQISKKELPNGDLTYTVKIIQDTPSNEWACVVGDIIHNLRSSLDLKVCELILQNGGGITKQTSFPIFKLQQTFRKLYQQKILGISQKHEQTIIALKPYSGGSELLWELHDLDILDKHRQLIIAGSAHKNIIIDMSSQLAGVGGAIFKDVPPMPIAINPADNAFPLKDGVEIFGVRAGARKNGDMDDPKFTFEIAYAKEVTSRGEPLIPKLEAIITCTENALSLLV